MVRGPKAVPAAKATPVQKKTVKKTKNVKPDTKKAVSEEKHFVDKAKLVECLNVLKKVQEERAKNAEKTPLFEQEEQYVLVEFILKKIPENYSTFIHRFPIPFHWRKNMNYETCMIVPDVNKIHLDDRELDLEQTKSKYQDLLEEANSLDLVTEILPMRQLRNEFRPAPLRKKLATTYDAFLCDKKLLQNRYNFLPRFLGKQFWVDAKNVPIMIDLKEDKKKLREQIESRLNEATIYKSGKGSTLALTVGTFSQDSVQLVENISATLAKLDEIFGANIRALSLKTKRSMAITFYMDLATSNDIDIARPEWKDEFEQDDFDFLTNSDVRVYKSGKIQIMKRKKEDGDNNDDVGDDDEVEDEQENKLIDSINEYVPDNQWARQKVESLGNSSSTPGKKSRRKKPRFFETSDDSKAKLTAQNEDTITINDA